MSESARSLQGELRVVIERGGVHAILDADELIRHAAPMSRDAGASSTLLHDLLRASLMCGLQADGPGVHQMQLFYCVWKMIGRRVSVESLQRRIETGVDDFHYWYRPAGTQGVYALTSVGRERAEEMFPGQPLLVPVVPPHASSFAMRSRDFLHAAVLIRNSGGRFSVHVNGEKLTGIEASVRMAQWLGDYQVREDSTAARSLFNFGLSRGWLLEWDAPGADVGEIDPRLEDSLASEPASGPARERRRALRSLAVRYGQPRFRQNLIEAYNGSCCVSDERILGALQAAHIRPYADDGTDEIGNGLLLRADIHNLFDLDFLRIDSRSWSVVIHPVLRGSSYEQFAGREVRRPENESLRPRAAYFDERYRRLKPWTS